MAIARKQQAQSWLLRAGTSLGRLYARQDKRAEGRRIVQEALSSFTEGHDTVDQIVRTGFPEGREPRRALAQLRLPLPAIGTRSPKRHRDMTVAL